MSASPLLALQPPVFGGYADHPELALRIAAIWELAAVDPDQVPARADEAVAQADALGEARGRFWAALTRALNTWRLRPLPQCEEDLQRARELWPEMRDERGQRLIGACEAALLLQGGQLQAAYERYNSLPLWSQPDRDDADDYLILHGRAVCATSLGKLEEAFRADYSNLQLTGRIGPPGRYCMSASHLGGILCAIERPEEGIELMQPMFDQQMIPPTHRLAWLVARHNLAVCKQFAGRMEESHAEFLELLEAQAPAKFPAFAFNIYENLATLSLELGRPDEAEPHHQAAWALARQAGRDSMMALCHVNGARLARARGDLATAVAELQQAQACIDRDPDLAMFSATGHVAGELLARCHAERGEFEQAYAAQLKQISAHRARTAYVARGQLAAQQVKAGLAVALHQTAELKQALANLKTAQQQLVLNEKMASVGTLTAGISHEINNPANFAHAGAQNLRDDLKRFGRELIDLADDTEVGGVLQRRLDALAAQAETIVEGTTRIRALVRDLRTFSRLDEAERQRVGVGESLRSTVHLVRTLHARHVDIVLALPVDPPVPCWPAQLAQVFMNLIVNACQAIEQQQRLNDEGAPGRLDIGTQLEPSWLLIEFRDTGCGMTPDVAARAFEPFFTTKPVGEGNGLGLAISFGIVQRHGGHIELQSTPGVGTCVSLRLPLQTSASYKSWESP